MVNEFDLIENIVQKKDIARLYALQNDDVFSIALHQILVSIYDADHSALNEPGINLFLAMHLENSGQSSSILSCLQEWFPQYLSKFVPALEHIGAVQSAVVIAKAINMLPEDGSWFFRSADDQARSEMSELDSQFSNYLDGNMPKLYREYAENCKQDIIELCLAK